MFSRLHGARRAVIRSLGLTGVSPGPEAVYRFKSNPRAVERAIAFTGADHILTASDYPPQIASIPKMLESLRAIRVSEED